MAERRRESGGRQWATSALVLAQVGVALAGLSPLLSGSIWWVAPMVVAVAFLATATLVRQASRHRIWGSLIGLVPPALLLSGVFAGDDALAGVIPTPDTAGALIEVGRQGTDSIARQRIPAEADGGILLLVCAGVLVVVWLMDLLASTGRMPALSGLPVLALLVVPGLVRGDGGDPWIVAATAVPWLLLLLLGTRRGTRRAALGAGAVGVAALLLAPLVAAPVIQPPPAGGGGSSTGFATGINPLVELGDDLRRGREQVVYEYTSSDGDGRYFRLAALDTFTGEAWEPSTLEMPDGNTVDAIGPPSTLGPDVATEQVATEVVMNDISSRWLPAPYAPASVEGLTGDWAWEPRGLSIRGDRSDAGLQQYTVQSLDIVPTAEQLRAADAVPDGFDRYLELPDGLPQSLADTAAEVTAGAENDYDRAVALQEFFTGGEFSYSEEAPVEAGFDSSGAAMLGWFLDARSGYCVHFSSAMAAMAREVGIPARVAVGFTSGDRVAGGQSETREVTTFDMHAWPELHFDGIGWVRFEPTPGVGAPPEVPSEVDTAAPTTAPTDPTQAPSSSATVGPQEPGATPTPSATTPGARSETGPELPDLRPALATLLALLVLAVPALVRVGRRTRRLTAGEESAVSAWVEILDTARDLGMTPAPAATPRERAVALATGLDDRGRAALRDLGEALEAEAYSSRSAGIEARHPRRVIRSLRAAAGLGPTVAAAVAPRTLFTPGRADHRTRSSA